MVDAIHSMFCDCCYKYSPFVLLLFIGAKLELDEGLEFIANPTNGRFESIYMDVGVDGGRDLGIKFEVNGVARLLVPSIGFCRRFKTLLMACPSIDFKHTNTSSFCKTTLFDPSSFDVPVFNSCNVSRNLYFKVSSWNFDFG
jgi:hypothetical protein